MDVLEGGLLIRLGQMDGAEQLLKRALGAAERQNDPYQQASALLNLSYAKKKRYRYDEAVEYGLRTVRIADPYGFRRLAAIEYMNLASFYRLLGDFDHAVQNDGKAVDLLAAIGDRGNLLIALGESGLLHMTLGQFDKAIAQYEHAFSLSRETGRNSDAAARNAVNLALTFIELHQWDKAEQWNDQARSIPTPDGSSGPYETLNSARIAQGRKQTDTAVRLYRQLIENPKLNAEILRDSHVYLAEIYADQKKTDQADRELRAALNIIDKTRSELLRPEFQITFLSSLIAAHQYYVDLLTGRNDDTSALRTIESSRARVLTERLGRDVPRPQAIDIPHLTQLAKDTNTAIISFWIAPGRSYAWLIDRTGVRRFTLPPVAEIESLVTKYRDVVEHPLKDPIASGDPTGPKLWSALLSDIAPRIPKGSRVVVIPDGPLHRLNLETLPVPTPRPHYWIEDVELSIAPSLAIAASKLGPVEKRGPSLLLIGAPDYTGTAYKPLQNAGAEIRHIQTRFPGITQAVYTGRAASPDAYRSSQPARFSLIHFAAHADASNESPLESAVILSRHGDAYKLYARDVIDQPIEADLVTISGCRSAGVRAYAGEGLIGFAWAFLQAGARAVVAGLWDVSDISTEPLMNEFYAAIASGQPPATAMRQAKLGLLEHQAAYSKPYYWAPFQVYVRSIRR